MTRGLRGGSLPALSALALLALPAFAESRAPQPFRRGNADWIEMYPGGVFHAKGFDVYEEFNPANYVRKDYIKRPIDKKAIHFYTHGRGISMTLGHKRRLVLIEDDEATKSSKVMVVDLQTGEQKKIDTLASKRFEEQTSPNPALIVVPVPYAFSPDDTQVLIKMELIYISVATPDLVECIKHTFRQRWYAVNSKSGRVLRVFRGKRTPEGWWAS